jgi:solute:Na+ symporter, SSS family
VNLLDYVVLAGTMLGIAVYGIWRTRGRRDLNTYMKGSGNTPWLVIGISVMATQASAITFMSTPGQGYADGLGFVQFYFGVPLAMIIIAAFFLPIYRRLNVYTAYEFLGRRFDGKTRLLGAALFLLQRGLGAGITIYAPAIILSTVFGWPLDLTIILSGTVVVIYTASGGSEAVSLTQKYQMAVIFAGMLTAFIVLLAKLPANLSLADALTVAGGFHKMRAIDFSVDVHRRYTLWSGLLGGLFIQLSYSGTDQSQVQRYISGTSLRESRLGLMFNALCKIPMQFFILLLGVSVFVFYQFAPTPIVFDQAAWSRQVQLNPAPLHAMEAEFASLHDRKAALIGQWLDARRTGDSRGETQARAAAQDAQDKADALRAKALQVAGKHATGNDNDYVFITFILKYLPHGVIGLLIAAFFGAALSSKAAELNALGSTTTVDLYRHMAPQATDAQCVAASRWFTVLWGIAAIAFALFADLSENLIQAVNILGSIFYGVMLGLFVAGFFLKWIGGTAIFWAAVISQIMVFVLYFSYSISYLWLTPIGCAACVVIGAIVQAAVET